MFCGRERLTAELAGLLAGTGIVMVTGASGAGKTSLLRAGLVPALARGVQVPGSQGWPVVSLTVTVRPLTDLAAGLARLDDRDPVAVRQRLADAPGQAHLLIRELTRNAARLVLIIDQFERVFAADGAQERAERAAFLDALSAAATRPAGPRGEPPARVVIAVRGDYWDRCAALPQLVAAMERDQLVVGPMPDAGLRRGGGGGGGGRGGRAEGAGGEGGGGRGGGGRRGGQGGEGEERGKTGGAGGGVGGGRGAGGRRGGRGWGGGRVGGGGGQRGGGGAGQGGGAEEGGGGRRGGAEGGSV